MRILALLTAGLFVGTMFLGCGPAVPTSGAKEEPKKEEPKAKDEEAVLGTWKVEKMETGGADAPPADALAKMQLKFGKDGKMSITTPDGKEKDYQYKMDPSAKMKTIDVIGEKQTALGVYDLDGDSMKLCLGTEGEKTRPTEFKGVYTKAAVLTMKRAKDK